MMLSKWILATGAAAAAIALGGACAKKPTPQPTTETQQTTGATMMAAPDCPVAVPGASVQTTETPTGVEMKFTTSGDIAELRRRVHAMSEHMNARSSGYGGGMAPGRMGPGMMGGADGGSSMGMGRGGMGMHGHGMMAGDAGLGAARTGMGMMPSMRSEVDEMEGGARMRITPLDPSQRDEFHREMKDWARMMSQRHQCPAVSGSATP